MIRRYRNAIGRFRRDNVEGYSCWERVGESLIHTRLEDLLTLDLGVVRPPCVEARGVEVFQGCSIGWLVCVATNINVEVFADELLLRGFCLILSLRSYLWGMPSAKRLVGV